MVREGAEEPQAVLHPCVESELRKRSRIRLGHPGKDRASEAPSGTDVRLSTGCGKVLSGLPLSERARSGRRAGIDEHPSAC